MGETSTSVMRIDRKSSIEKEPRTLDDNQIQYAREAALYVVSTRSTEEAMNIFTEGLEPVKSLSKMKRNDMDTGKELQYLDDEIHPPILRDVLSAPF